MEKEKAVDIVNSKDNKENKNEYYGSHDGDTNGLYQNDDLEKHHHHHHHHHPHSSEEFYSPYNVDNNAYANIPFQDFNGNNDNYNNNEFANLPFQNYNGNNDNYNEFVNLPFQNYNDNNNVGYYENNKY